MINVVVIDSNIQSRELLKNNLNSIENINVVKCYEKFDDNINFENINLVVFDVNSSTANETLEKVEKLKNKNINFIATSYEINSLLVSQTLSKGVLDFLLKPIIPSVLEIAIKKISQQEKQAKTIAVFSNKGGVGKTSLITNLAWEIYDKTKDKVCILDLSFNSENATNFLNVEQKYNLDYILSSIEGLNKNTLLSLMGKYQDSQIYLLETKEEVVSELKYTPQKIAKIINSLKQIFDYILIDTTNLINESTISILNHCDLILLLSTTNKTSLKNCLNCCELFDKIGYNDDKIKIIINRYIENQELSLDEIEKTINKQIFNTIPNNYLTLIDAINLGNNVGEVNPQSNIAKAYKKIANDILNIDFSTLKTNAKYHHGIFNLLKKMGEE
ncbi:MAG: response regulator [Cyanobacteria bacterium SIG27]|nr:response regulator [Cyanobacteria bacterium SIG27]